MPKRNKIEEETQNTVVEWAVLNQYIYPELQFLHHSPSGGKRHISVAIKMKRAGTKSGFPDLILPVKRAQYSGLFIEMKAPKGVMSDAQKKWATFLTQQDFLVTLCRSTEEAIGVLKSYLKLT